MSLFELLENVSGANQEYVDKANYRWTKIAKPLNSLGILEKTVVKLAGINNNFNLDKRIVIPMCADNGVVDENDKITNEIINLRPDYVFVAKGAPLQDEWINKIIQKTDKGLFMGVGGSFDVLSGEVKRAPEIWQRLNLEWLYRIAGNPKRWKRSMALPKFIIEISLIR